MPWYPRLAVVLRDFRAPWAVAGGWAIDLAIGHVTRSHGDVDVALLREDQARLPAALPAWEFQAVVDGTLVPWTADMSLQAPVHEIHARNSTDAEDRIEFLLNDRAPLWLSRFVSIDAAVTVDPPREWLLPVFAMIAVALPPSLLAAVTWWWVRRRHAARPGHSADGTA